MFSLPAPLSQNQKKYNIATVHPGNFPESYDHEHSMARSEISTIISAAKRLKKKVKGEGNIEAWVQSKITKAADYLDAAADYIDSGEMKTEQNNLDEIAPALVAGGIAAAAATPYLMKKFVKPAVDKALDGERKTSPISGERYDSAIQKLRRESKTFNQFMEDWQSVNRKDKTDGLSQKAVNAYRRENPGSKLQTAVTEKKPSGKRAKRRKSFCRRMSGMKDKLTSAKTARDPDSRINKALRRWNCN
jgi:F0F1-type ATP synthase membrane subunit b/b'